MAPFFIAEYAIKFQTVSQSVSEWLGLSRRWPLVISSLIIMAHGRLKVVAEFEGPACVVISAWRDQKGSKRAARERRQRLRRIRLAFKEGRVITC